MDFSAEGHARRDSMSLEFPTYHTTDVWFGKQKPADGTDYQQKDIEST